MLSLIFMDAFYLHVEERVAWDGNTSPVGDEPCKIRLIRAFYFAPSSLESALLGQRLDLGISSSNREIHLSPMASVMSRVRPGLAKGYPSAGGDTVGDVVKLPRRNFIKVGHYRSFSSSVCNSATPLPDGSRGRDMGHADVFVVRFVDDRETSHPFLVADIGVTDLVKKPPVNLENNLKMTGQYAPKSGQRPLFESLRKKGVVRVGKGLLRNRPGEVPVDTPFVNQDSHKLDNRNRRVGIIELDCKPFVKGGRGLCWSSWIRIISRSEQATKKYCWASRPLAGGRLIVGV